MWLRLCLVTPSAKSLFRSGQSIFSRPKPIDINTARRAGFMDLEFDSEDDVDGELSRPLVRNSVLFEAEQERGQSEGPDAFTPMPRAAQAVRDRDTEDVWAELG